MIMKKIIKLNESDLLRIIKSVISEQIKQGFGGDPYQYKKVGNNYFYATKGKSDWKQARNQTSIDAIKTKIFQEPTTQTKTSKSQTTTQTQTSSKPKSKFDTPNLVLPSDTPEKMGDTAAKKNMGNQLSKDFSETQNLVGKISKRTFEKLTEIRKAGWGKNDTFVIVNKNQAVISLFGPGYKFIDSGRIVYGGGTEPEPNKTKTYSDWFDISMKFCQVDEKGVSKNKTGDCNKITKYYKKYPQTIGKKPPFTFPKDGEFKLGFPYSFEASRATGSNFTPSGVYDVNLGTKTGYDPTQRDSVDTWKLKTLDGETLPAAIHYGPGSRQDKIKKLGDVIPDIDVSSKAKVGAGCINLSPKTTQLFRQYSPKKAIILPENPQNDKLIIVSTPTFFERIKDVCVNSFENLFKDQKTV